MEQLINDQWIELSTTTSPYPGVDSTRRFIVKPDKTSEVTSGIMVTSIKNNRVRYGAALKANFNGVMMTTPKYVSGSGAYFLGADAATWFNLTHGSSNNAHVPTSPIVYETYPDNILHIREIPYEGVTTFPKTGLYSSQDLVSWAKNSTLEIPTYSLYFRHSNWFKGKAQRLTKNYSKKIETYTHSTGYGMGGALQGNSYLLWYEGTSEGYVNTRTIEYSDIDITYYARPQSEYFFKYTIDINNPILLRDKKNINVYGK
jgi:hypothetical protein